MEEGITDIYEKEEDIKELVNKLKVFSFEDFIKNTHFYYSLEEKGTDIKLLKEKYIKFELIRLINKRRHKNGKISYDFYYELKDKTYIVYAVSFEDVKPRMLNAFHVNRNFKKFKEQLIKAYKDKLIYWLN